MERAGLEVHVGGRVQGVGMRPWVARTARALGLAGRVRNSASGVVTELEGSPAALDRFVARLRAGPPPPACIETIEARPAAARGVRGFEIAPSVLEANPARPRLPLDMPPCAACLDELFDPHSRRHRYAFTHCAACGPRAAIVRALPFDRERTTLAHLPPCRACARERSDPEDRRYHAQTLACPACGPRLALEDPVRGPLPGDPVERAAACLAAGGIVAMKGAGGYHLCVDATRGDAVARLRARKRRPTKPLAVLVPDLETAHRTVRLAPADLPWLTGPERAIVVAPRRASAEVAAEVAPGISDLGVMLPVAPLHWLILYGPGTRPGTDAPRFSALVLTSANRSGEPTLHRDDDARAALSGIADVVLAHDRPVARPNDDPVVRTAPGGPVPIRLSRGTAPCVLPLPAGATQGPPVLALGGDLKCAPALAVDGEVWLAEHVGDVASLATAEALDERVAALCALAGVKPQALAHDLHPEYATHALAHEIAARLGARPVAVQHHHAHAAAVLLEHGIASPALAWVLDGAGYGRDGTFWGGELLWVDGARCERVAHLEQVPLPGGDAAAREPWRMALAWMRRAFPEGPPTLAWHGRRDASIRVLERALERDIAGPLTSSCGRLFDAVGSLLDVGDRSHHEGEVAGALEALAAAARAAHPLGGEAPAWRRADGESAVSVADLVRALVLARVRGAPREALARGFHEALAARLAGVAREAAASLGVERVVLAGGCFVNRLLLADLTHRLDAAGLRVLRPFRLPVGDGGLAAGQAAVVRAALSR